MRVSFNMCGCTSFDSELSIEDSATGLEAAYNDDPRVTQVLLSFGAEPDTKDMDGKSPLHVAAKIGNTGVAHALLVHDALVQTTDNFGVTPLHIAATNEVAMLFVRSGAHVTARDVNGKGPLHYAAKDGRVQVAETWPSQNRR